MAYRKAKRIELHEAHTAITTSEEQNNFATRGNQIHRTAYLIRPSDLAALAQELGLNLPQTANNSTAAVPVDESNTGKRLLLRAYQELPADTSGMQIVSLECDVQDANLVDIRITSQADHTPTASGQRVESITHSGSFTIWWQEDTSTAVDHLMAIAEEHPTIPVEDETTIARGTVIDLAMDESNGGGIETSENQQSREE